MTIGRFGAPVGVNSGSVIGVLGAPFSVDDSLPGGGGGGPGDPGGGFSSARMRQFPTGTLRLYPSHNLRLFPRP